MDEQQIPIPEQEGAAESAPVATAVMEKPTTNICAACGTEIPEGVKFCPNCGKQVEIATVAAIQEAPPAPAFCAACGTEIPKGMKFCPNCGKQAGEPVAVAPVAAAPEKKRSKKPLIIAGIAIGVVLVLLLGLVAGFAGFANINKEIPAEKLDVSETAIELKEGEKFTLSCTVYPKDATDKTVEWYSSDKKVATVNAYGQVTAVGKGTCVITASCGDVSEKVNVTVKTKIDFSKLYDGINSSAKYGWTLGSDGSYLSADTNVYNLDDYSNFTIWESIKQMNKSLGLPDSLTEDMNHTTWSMGRQTQKFESVGVEVTWTYHPDKGMEVTYKLLAD